jgi:hypothetical protein
MLPTQSNPCTFTKGDSDFLLHIVEVILPYLAQQWREVTEIYNSGVSFERQRCDAELRTEFRLVRLHLRLIIVIRR